MIAQLENAAIRWAELGSRARRVPCPPVTVWTFLAVAAAGAACGVVNSIAGGGSLILFPVLLLTGLKPLDANVTNSVSTWAGYLGGVGGFRSEIRTNR